jgi:hypothetical protein
MQREEPRKRSNAYAMLNVSLLLVLSLQHGVGSSHIFSVCVRTKMVLAWRVLRSIWRRRELRPRPLTQREMLEVSGECPKGVRKTIQSCLDFWQRGPLSSKDVVDTVRPFARRSMARMPTSRVALER